MNQRSAHGGSTDLCCASSRIYQFAKQHLFEPYSAIYTCPLSMTDGATRLCEIIKSRTGKDDSGTLYSISGAFPHAGVGEWRRQRRCKSF